MAKPAFYLSWLDSDDDGRLLKGLAVSALLILLLVFLFGPRYQPAKPAPPVPAPLSVAPLPAQQILTAARPKVLYWVAEPSFPAPVITSTPFPTPTPEGGGILRKIAFASNRADGRFLQIYMMDADGYNLERLTETKAFDRDPHFSYDGRTLAFSSNRSHATYQIFLMDMETRDVRQLTSGPDDKTNPFWSPDGRSLLYTAHHSGANELFIIGADGRDPRPLRNTFGASHGYWYSPNGRQISKDSGANLRNEIFQYDLGLQSSSLLIQNDDLSFRHDGVFSPVGDKMVFTSDAQQRGRYQLYLLELGSNRYYPLTSDELTKDDPLFSPDGSKLAYVALWEGAWNIFVMDADGRHSRNLTRSYYDHLVPTWR